MSAIVFLLCLAGCITIIVVIICYYTKRNNYLRNGGVISQAPGFAYQNQINRPPIPPNNPLVVNRWGPTAPPPYQVPPVNTGYNVVY